MKKCSLKGCGNVFYCKGFCKSHYDFFRRGVCLTNYCEFCFTEIRFNKFRCTSCWAGKKTKTLKSLSVTDLLRRVGWE